MINKKISRILGPILGIMGFMLTMGAAEFPVFAEDKVQSGYAQVENTTAGENADYFTNINKSVTENGVKVTIDKVAASKSKLKVIVKAESDKTFDKKKLEDLEELVTYGEGDKGSESMSFEVQNDKMLLLTTEQDIDENEFPEKGTLRVDLVIPEYKVNVGIDADVDFTEAFQNILEKDLAAKFKTTDADITFGKLETNNMGTTINYSGSFSGDDVRSYRVHHESAIILKIGDKMYKMTATDSSGSRNAGDNITIIKGKYETQAVKFKDIKDQKSIEIIPLFCKMSENDMNKAMKEFEEQHKKGESTKDLVNNITYSPTFDFDNGTEGKIYKIERKDNAIKIYCKGTTENESLLLASSMHLSYGYKENDNKYIPYDSDKNMSFYKDPNDSLGYVVEFDNLEKDKTLNLFIDNSIKTIDKFTVGDKIQVLK